MQEISNNFNSAEEQRLASIESGLKELNDNVMACFVQLSRIYDILASEHYRKYSKYGPEAEQLLDGHEAGYINSTAPILKAFGEPEVSDEEVQGN